MPEFERFEPPMRLGLIGDTHRTSRTKRPLPVDLLLGLEDCDLICHTGDVNARWVLDLLATIAPLRAVGGNNEEDVLGQELGLEHFFEIGSFKIGLMHGHHTKLTARQHTLDRMRGVVDCAIYGHSHRPEIEERDGLLMINPGSPTQKRYAAHTTFAILTVDETLRAQLINLD
ncbi:metallophosphoesterase family protein [soil metagenome]